MFNQPNTSAVAREVVLPFGCASEQGPSPLPGYIVASSNLDDRLSELTNVVVVMLDRLRPVTSSSKLIPGAPESAIPAVDCPLVEDLLSKTRNVKSLTEALRTATQALEI